MKKIEGTIEYLFDADTFSECRYQEVGVKQNVQSSVITGVGKIKGKTICVVIQDFLHKGGTIGEIEATKILNLQKYAFDNKLPLIILCESGGARIQEGIVALDYMGEILKNCVKASGILPQIAVILGTCAGGTALWASECDFVFMVEGKSELFITGPKVIKSVTGENVCKDDLGGSKVHLQESGLAHFGYVNELECLKGVRELLEYISSSGGKIEKNYLRNMKNILERKDIKTLVPKNQKEIYDIRPLIEKITDDNSFMEVQEHYAQNAVVGFATIEQHVVGIVANQPTVLSGSIDTNAADKMSDFIKKCNYYSIPIITFVDTPGFYPGKRQESNGLIKKGTRLINSFVEADVPKITIILRKAFGGAYIAMNSKCIGADMVFAWPDALIGVMGACGEKCIVQNRGKKSMDKEVSRKRQLGFAIKEHSIDEIIRPKQTREKIVKVLVK